MQTRHFNNNNSHLSNVAVVDSCEGVLCCLF